MTGFTCIWMIFVSNTVGWALVVNIFASGRPTIGNCFMRIVIAIAFLTLIVGPSCYAQAHAMLDHANPHVGGTVKSVPGEIVLWFTEALEPAFSRIEVRNVNGVRVDTGKAQVDRADRTELRIAVKPLSAGAYNVFWRVLSVDSHATQGNFLFHVSK